MKKRTAIAGTLLTIIFIGFYLINSNFGKTNLDALEIAKISSSSALITFVIYFIWNSFLWSLKPFKSMHKKPIVKGVWESHSNNQVFFELKIRQSFDGISLNLKGQDFIAVSLVSNLIQDSSGSYLYFVYISKPRKKYYNIHQIHHGTMRLHCQELALVGEYFTSNGYSGKIEFYRKGMSVDPNEIIPIEQNDTIAETSEPVAIIEQQ